MRCLPDVGAVTPLDRSSPVPLWSQLLGDLRRRLSSGEFSTRFPTDEALREEYEVSRQTVREAVRRLQEDGYLVRERGRGTILTPIELEQPLRSLYSMARTIEAQGHRERSIIESIRVADAGAHAGPLDLAPDDEVIAIERVRLLDDEPLSLERSWLPAARTRDILDADLTSGSLYDALRRCCNVVVVKGWERIRPLNPTPEERKTLTLSRAEAVFQVERVVFDEVGPVEERLSLIRGDRYCFRAEWTGGPAA